MKTPRSFAANAVVYGLGSIVVQALSAVLLPLYAHYLTPADYGILDLLQRTGGIISLLLLGRGVQMAVVTFYCQAKSSIERTRVFSTIATVYWTIVCLCILVGVAIAPAISSGFRIGSPGLVLMGIACVFAEGLVALPLALFQARIETVSFAIATILLAVTRLSLIVVTVVYLDLGTWGVLGASMLSFLLFGAYLSAREVHRGFICPERNLTHEIIRFALPLMPAGIFGVALDSADRFFLLEYCNTAQVGTYAFGHKLATMIPALVTMPLWKVWSAQVYEVFERTNASSEVGRAILRLMSVQVFVGLGVSLLSAELVTLLAPHEYHSATCVIPLLVVASSLQLFANLCESTFWVKRKTKWKPITAALSAVSALVWLQLLVPRFGEFGAALALVLAFAGHLAATFFLTQQIFKISYAWRDVIGSVALAICLYFIGDQFPPNLLGTLGRVVIWISWPVLLWQLGVFEPEEKAWVANNLSSARRAAQLLLFSGSR